MFPAIAAEFDWRPATDRGYDLRGAVGSTGVAAGALVFGVVNGAAIALVLQGVETLGPVRWRLEAWPTWPAGFRATELAHYVHHRMSHEVRRMWASHATHHSAEAGAVLGRGASAWALLRVSVLQAAAAAADTAPPRPGRRCRPGEQGQGRRTAALLDAAEGACKVPTAGPSPAAG